MKAIYHSDKLRLKVSNEKTWGLTNIVLRIQVKRWLFWSTVNMLYIEVKNYWGYIPGDKHFGGCLRMGLSNGYYTECWPPDIFNLKKRANEFLLEYYEANKERLLYERSIKKQLGTI